MRLVNASPFAIAAFVTGGGGGGAAVATRFTFQAGALASVTFNNLVTISGRAYLDMWSDRLCKEARCTSKSNPTNGPDVCQGMTQASLADITKAQELHGEMDLTTRDTGARVSSRFVVEPASRRTSTSSPSSRARRSRTSRASHSSLFTRPLLSEDDPIDNGRAGVTFKF